MDQATLDIETLNQMLDQKRFSELRELLAQSMAPDIADVLLSLRRPFCLLVFRLMPRDKATEVFSYLTPDDKDGLLRSLTDTEARFLLSNLSPDDRTAFLEEMPGQMIQRLANLLSAKDLKETMQLLGYPEDSVGRLMTPDYVAVRPEWTVQQAIDHIRAKGKDSETINVVYVVDLTWKLLDEIELRKLILARSDEMIVNLMDDSFVAVNVQEDQEVAVQLIQRYDIYALPVVDSAGVLLGIVTVDDVMDIAEEEVTEDFQMGAAVDPLESSYSETGILTLFRKRIGWLAVLVILNILTSGIMAAYENVLASLIVLAFFIPMLIAGGGNAGSQSATLWIRSQATGDTGLQNFFRIIGRELVVGLMLGACMGLEASAFAFIYGGGRLALVVGISMMLIVTAINLIGIILPFTLVKLKFDPAMASSPLIASLADGIGLVVYFTVAMRFLKLQ